MKNLLQYSAMMGMATILSLSIAQAQDRTSASPAPPGTGGATQQSPADATAVGNGTQKPALLAQTTEPTAAPQSAALQSTAPAAPVDPPPATALPTPAITGPLSGLPPFTFEAGPMGKISVNGTLSGLGMWTGNYVAGDKAGQVGLSNGQVFIQKADGRFQFYLQAGAYNIAALGTPYLETDKTISKLFGPIPVAFFKLQAAKNTSILVGALPTLIGAEYTFTFENMNVHRGLLWNQENAVNRGIQINQTLGKFTASFSWNDGFYSNRYSWLTGSLAYTKGPHTLAFVAGGNYGETAYQTYATPVQNNSTIYNVIYTYLKGPWIIQPYFQYTNVAANPNIGVVKGASTTGGAILASYAFKHGFSLPVRWEYIASSGSSTDGSVNLLYGPGSNATSITVTPTVQRGGFFVRGDLAYVHASNITPGFAFSQTGANQNQPRAMAEFGFIFGHNTVEK
ncbi:MAG TPA: outer membrane beta-barrel protein [Candidatus Binatia bacterium]|nr:outer membrane beta-barrel protein [Candidatus Binatia bacterium]